MSVTMKAPCVVFAVVLACGQAANAVAQRPGVMLGDLTWPEAEQRLRKAPVVIVPFGAGAKEHGPHLPLSADQIQLEYLLKVVLDAEPVIVAPPILHGWFPAFRDFPGTDIDDPDIFWRYVYEVAQSLVRHGAQRILFLNTGVSRSTGLPIAIAARELHERHRVPTLVVSADDLGSPEQDALQTQRAGSHADEIETSLILALRPDLVQMGRAVEDYRSDSAAIPGYRPRDFSRRPGDPDESTTGIFGDPRSATAQKGRRVLELRGQALLRAVRGFAVVPVPPGR